MKIKAFNSRNTWLWLLTAMLMFLSPPEASAKMKFGEYSQVTHEPGMNAPWIEVLVPFYDTNGKDSGFSWIWDSPWNIGLKSME